jgi:hypothetical protein
MISRQPIPGERQTEPIHSGAPRIQAQSS